jgi:2'-hydroxyisoflavone reductase
VGFVNELNLVMTQQILILGGTNFIGRNLVEKLKTFPQYELTLFNRGQTGPALFPEIKQIIGDRADVAQLAGQYWDCIIDLSCYYPEHLLGVLNAVEGRVRRYVFVSSISAYALSGEMVTEDTPTLPDGTEYGKRKAMCERILLGVEGLDAIIFRPSVVYGKYDPTDRLYYWLYKTRYEQPVLIPGDVNDKITLTYVADLVEIIRQSIEIVRHESVYNVSTHDPLTLTSLVQVVDKDVLMVNVAGEELIRQGLLPEEHIPLWFNMPLMIGNERLKRDFAPLIPFEKSIADTIAYYEKLGWPKHCF